jgi:hypothetical protein
MPRATSTVFIATLRQLAVGTASEVVGIGYIDGSRRYKAVGLGKRRHSKKSHRYRHAVGTES